MPLRDDADVPLRERLGVPVLLPLAVSVCDELAVIVRLLERVPLGLLLDVSVFDEDGVPL